MSVKALTLSASAKFDDGISPLVTAAVLKRTSVVVTSRSTITVQLITQSAAVAIDLAAAATYANAVLFINLDPNNFINIYRTSGPTNLLAVLGPDTDGDGNGGFFMCSKLGSALLAPYAQADTADCRMIIFACPP